MRTVEDGSEQDYDSHIMVWQVDDSPGQVLKTPAIKAATAADQHYDSFGMASSSPSASSSIDMGQPSPGSGLQTEVSEDGSRQDMTEDTDDEEDDPDSVRLNQGYFFSTLSRKRSQTQ